MDRKNCGKLGYPEQEQRSFFQERYRKSACMSIGRAMCRVVAALSTFVVLLALTAGQTKADRIPGTAFSGALYYVSKDMEPITIEFVHEPWVADKEDTQKAIIEIPRAYVNFVDGYSHSPARNPGQQTPKSSLRGWKDLPDTVRTQSILVSLTDPDGDPYTIEGVKISEKVKDEDGISLRRGQSQFATINFARYSKNQSSSLRRAREKNRTLIEYEGLFYDPGPAAGHFYFNTGPGALKFVRCMRSPEQARPNVLCTYTVYMGDHFVANVQFLDFRLHGGRT